MAYAVNGEMVSCRDGSIVHFVGVASPLGRDLGASWATELTNWFLAGKTITLEYDMMHTDPYGMRYGYPHLVGNDGHDYNVSAILIFVGMAHYKSDGVDVRYDGWFTAAEHWARVACWNMWAAGNPFSAESGCR